MLQSTTCWALPVYGLTFIVGLLGCQRPTAEMASKSQGGDASRREPQSPGELSAMSSPTNPDSENGSSEADRRLEVAADVSETASTSADPQVDDGPSDKADKSNPPQGKSAKGKIVRTEAEWRKLLNPMQYHVLREKGTERPFTNKYDHHFEPGSYACAACGQVLFEADTKFNSGCGWPAFYAAKAEDRVVLTKDLSHGMVRTEVTCAKCDSHLGHIFDDAPDTPTGQRYCINSVSLTFLPTKKGADKGSDKAAEQGAEEEAEKAAGDASEEAKP